LNVDLAAVIVAVASPPGRGLRGIVRVSGGRVFALLEGHLDLGGDIGRRGAHRGRLSVGGLEVACVAIVFPGPGSYTGEDAVELQVPGNPGLLERVVDGLIESGGGRGIDVRRAEAGEFTARAFLNGKMGLTEAEGVAAIVAAQSDAQLRAGRMLAAGRLGRLARSMADELAGALALVEAGIDFTDQEDVVAIEPRALHERLTAQRTDLGEQLERAVGSEHLDALPRVVLTGAPNAGKSTLFNALLRRPRAVVSAIAGTTRDVLAEPLAIDTAHGPAEVMLTDLAGADARDDALVRAMQAAAGRAIEQADLVLHCAPVGEPAPQGVARHVLIVRTKADLGGPRDAAAGLAVSAVTGDGLDGLRAEIARRLADRAVSLAADALALQPRHEAALRSAHDHLAEAAALLEPALGQRHLPHPEVVAAAMRAGLDELGRLAGDVTPDDVLERIFATFCVGK
jgi:tRNA modification GTPase